MPIIKELEQKIIKREKEFVYPLYENYCFSNIPSSILSAFNVKTNRPILPKEIFNEVSGSEKIILLLIDGFGYLQWLKHFKQNDFLKLVTQKGKVFPITSVFPSTTAAALTTINTGLTPQEHALPEWYVYFKEIDMIVTTLPFTPFGANEQDKLLKMGVDPKILFCEKTIHQKLKENGIKSFIFSSKTYSKSVYSSLSHAGGQSIPFIDSSDLAVKLRKTLEKNKGPAYFYVYFGSLDSISHEYGPHSEEYKAELSLFSFAFKKLFLEKLDEKTKKETKMLVTADHGQVKISPKETLYLNKFLTNEDFARGKKENPILPTGGPRDLFLHIERSKINEVKDLLAKKLNNFAKVEESKVAIKNGLFGINKPKKKFYDRVGDLLVIPYKNNSVWYEHMKGNKIVSLGHHGGLNKEEMIVPLAITELGDLK
jgi:hypothetical protein